MHGGRGGEMPLYLSGKANGFMFCRALQHMGWLEIAISNQGHNDKEVS